MKKKILGLELFAGAGGMAIGLEKAGVEGIGFLEIDRTACETLKANRPEWNVICEDITKISGLDLEKYFNIKKGELDLISGGSPCQSFSSAGKKMGLEDARGTLFFHYATFVEKLKPRMFIFENVKGLLSHDKGKTFETVLEIFDSIGYDIEWKVMKAWDYGIAQKRERFIAVGKRKDLKIKFNFPKIQEYKPVLKDALKNVPESPCAKYSEKRAEILKHVPQGGWWKDLPPEIKSEYAPKQAIEGNGGSTGVARRLSWEEPCLTIMTTPIGKMTERCHPDETRSLSVRESARIQSFPDEWQFCGKMSEQYRQIGNAVPPLLAYEIGKEIKKSIENLMKK